MSELIGSGQGREPRETEYSAWIVLACMVTAIVLLVCVRIFA